MYSLHWQVVIDIQGNWAVKEIDTGPIKCTQIGNMPSVCIVYYRILMSHTLVHCAIVFTTKFSACQKYYTYMEEYNCYHSLKIEIPYLVNMPWRKLGHVYCIIPSYIHRHYNNRYSRRLTASQIKSCTHTIACACVYRVASTWVSLATYIEFSDMAMNFRLLSISTLLLRITTPIAQGIHYQYKIQNLRCCYNMLRWL